METSNSSVIRHLGQWMSLFLESAGDGCPLDVLGSLGLDLFRLGLIILHVLRICQQSSSLPPRRPSAGLAAGFDSAAAMMLFDCPLW